jgi:hypothetical protein
MVVLNLLIRFFSVWGILDAFLLVGNPRRWARFWRKTINGLSKQAVVPGLLAIFQIAACLWIIDKTRRRG